MQFEHFKETLRRFGTVIEDLTIENQVYFAAILESSEINFPTLTEQVAEAKADPERRKQVHQMYSEMWQALEGDGIAAYGEGLLQDLPRTEKLN